MTLQEFINKYLGKQVEFHSYGTGALYQCTDLVNKYIVDVLGYDPIIGTNAKDFKDRFNKDQFKWVANTPEGVAEKGDIVVWNGRVGGGAGHVAIVESANVNSFKSLDQNWSKPQRVTEETHNYTNVSGWLRPIKKDVEPEPTIGWTNLKEAPPVYVLEELNKMEEFKELKKRKLISDKDALDTTYGVLINENDLRNKAVAGLARCEGNFEGEKDAWTDRAVKAENKNKEYEKRIKTLSGRYATPEERIQELEEKLSNSPTNMDKKALIEAGKELGRLALFGIVAYAIGYVTELPQTETTAIVLFALRFVDKFMHEYGKDNENETLTKGLTRF